MFNCYGFQKWLLKRKKEGKEGNKQWTMSRKRCTISFRINNHLCVLWFYLSVYLPSCLSSIYLPFFVLQLWDRQVLHKSLFCSIPQTQLLSSAFNILQVAVHSIVRHEPWAYVVCSTARAAGYLATVLDNHVIDYLKLFSTNSEWGRLSTGLLYV